MNRIPIYTYCDECSEVIPSEGHIHTAARREFNLVFGNFIDRTTHLCCKCIVVVGGQCDEPEG